MLQLCFYYVVYFCAIFFLTPTVKIYLFPVLVDQIINDDFGSCYGLTLKIAKATSPPSGVWGEERQNVGGANGSHTLMTMMSHYLCSVSPATGSRSSLSATLKTGLFLSSVCASGGPSHSPVCWGVRANWPRCHRLRPPSARNCLFCAAVALRNPPPAGKSCLMFVVFECAGLADMLSLWCCNPVTKYVLYLLLGIFFLASVALNYNHSSILFFFFLQALEQEAEMM